MAAGKGKQFLLLFWKNWIIQSRKICCTSTQIIVPLLLSLLLLAIRGLLEVDDVDEPTTWGKFSVDELPFGLSPTSNGGVWKLAYTPDNGVTQRLMGHVSDQLGVDVSDMGYNSENRMVRDLTRENEDAFNTLGGIVFTSSFSGGSLANNVKYKIRLSSLKQNCDENVTCDTSDDTQTDWQTGNLFTEGVELGPRNNEDKYGGEPGYYLEGFLSLQRAVDRAIILEHSALTDAEVDDVAVLLNRYPYPKWLNDQFIPAVAGTLPLFIMIIFLCVAPCIAMDIVTEKERKLKETMKLMGMAGWLQWLAWFCKYLAYYMITVIVMSVLYSIPLGDRGAVVNRTDGSLLFVLLLLYTISVILFSFAVSVFFSSANLAAAATGVLFFLTYVPYFYFQPVYYSLSMGAKLGSCLLPNIAMAFAFNLISQQEAAGVGMQWSNMHQPVNVTDQLTLLHCFLFLLLDTFICFLICWYVEAIKPGEFGVPLPWYFPCTKWYWCGSSRPMDEEADASVTMDSTQHEELPQGATSGIKIRGLRKVFNACSKNPRVAVNSLSMDMVEGQITALLGHNGAGKTTTMFMLTGFLEPTSGNALVGGYDIRKNLSKVRENLGLCPQHDVLFDVLTVKEHLKFFGQLKGSENVDKEVDEMIDLLNLKDKTNRQARTLSGGMKRKLCVGIALIGNSKIIILDEPTSGMDPEARRQTWDILQRARKGRTMLLTTHFMDEADYLGDRIAIMSQGELVCSGSSLFLKKRYGVGYHMNMVKTGSCNTDKVASLIREYAPNAGLESDAGAELSFVLPDENSPRFEELFTKLEEQKSALGITSWGASVTTMEEVFLKVGEEEAREEEAREEEMGERSAGGKEPQASASEKKLPPLSAAAVSSNGMDKKGDKDENEGADNWYMKLDSVGPTREKLPPIKPQSELTPESNEGGVSDTGSFDTEVDRNSGFRLWLQQFWAMFFKRVLVSWRSPLVTVGQLSLPFIFALLGCLTKYAETTDSDPTALTFKFTDYDDTFGAYKGVGNGYGTEINDLSRDFKGYLHDEKVSTEQVSSGDNYGELKDYLVKRGTRELETYINSDIVAGYFQGNYSTDATLLARGLFNNQAIHSPGMALMAISNAILRYLTGSDDYSIRTTNHPLPLPASFQAENDLTQDSITAFNIALLTGMGMSFLIGTFVVFLVKERSVKAKHSQFTSGVPAGLFWMGTYLWDLINFIIPCMAILILFAAFDIKGYIVGNNLGVCFLLFFFYGLSVLPFVYLLSYAFDNAASALVAVILINMITGVIATLVIFVLKFFTTKLIKDVTKILEWVFYVLLPNFCFSNGLQELYNNYSAQKTCEQTEKDIVKQLEDLGLSGRFATFKYYCDEILKDLDYTNTCCPNNCGSSCTEYTDNDLAWESPGIGRAVVFMVLQTLVYFAILFFLESGLAKRLWQSLTAGAAVKMQGNGVMPADVPIGMLPMVATNLTEDDDVAAERSRIEQGDIRVLTEQESVVLNGLTKFYGGFQAVNELSIGIKQGECFGLLGVNGAGKTTTFKMLTGDETVSSGKAYIKGYNVATQIKQVQQRVGYCPQFDALIDKLTVRETLTMYARLRGIPEKEIPGEVERLVKKLLLTEYISKLAGNLSGGNKRKLSTAIALVGNPPIVFLDEPTTGMDPVARRQLWNTLVDVRQAGRTIILTSHSMEECEALCTRLVVMVNGQFKCLGQSQHLKYKFGEGFALMAKVTPGQDSYETQMRTSNMSLFIQNNFPGCVLKDSHPGLVLYQISSANTTLAQVFGMMERNKTELRIEDYSVSQTTLEQVFINFARVQQPPLDNTFKYNLCPCCATCCCCS